MKIRFIRNKVSLTYDLLVGMSCAVFIRVHRRGKNPCGSQFCCQVVSTGNEGWMTDLRRKLHYIVNAQKRIDTSKWR